MSTTNLDLEEINSTDTISTALLTKMNSNFTKVDEAYGELVDHLLEKTSKDNLTDAIEFVDQLPNTLDATATASDILNGKTAYANREKVTGTALSEEITATTDNILSGKTVYDNTGTLISGTMVDNSNKTVESTSSEVSDDNYVVNVPANGYYDTTSQLSRPKADVIADVLPTTTTATASTIFNGQTAYDNTGALITGTGLATASTATASTIRSGYKAYNNSGTLITGTAYATTTTATASDILSGQTAYTNTGTLLTGSYVPSTKVTGPTINLELTGDYTTNISAYGAEINSNGVLVIWARSKSTAYEHINFNASSIGAGTVGYGWGVTSFSTDGPIGLPHACTVTGLGSYSTINITLDASSVNTTHDYIRLNVTLTAIASWYEPKINITLSGTYSGYISGYGAGMDSSGRLAIWAISNSTNYEHIRFYASSIGTGTAEYGWDFGSVFSSADEIYPQACTVTGLGSSSAINITLNANGVDATYDYVTLAVTLTAS